MTRLLIVTVLVLAASVSGASTVRASCALPPGGGPATLAAQIDSAPVAFVGTVLSTASNGRLARVRVESVWKGPLIPTLVTVSGTPDTGSAATSVDRTYQVGQRYLIVPFTATSPFQDNSCSPTQPYSSQLAALKPATAQPPAPGSDGPDPTASPLASWLWPGLAGILVAGIAVALAVLWRRRRGRPDGQAAAPSR